MPAEYGRPPIRSRIPHAIADIAELELIFQEQDRISRITLHSILGEELGVMFDEETASSRGYDDIEDRIAPPGASSAEVKEVTAVFVSDVMSQFAFRKSTLGSLYPFTFEDGILELESNITEEQSLYVFLLVCSCLRAFKDKKVEQKCASLFEEVAVDAMRGLLPKSASVMRFGVGSADRRNHFGTKFKDALAKLISDIRCEESHGIAEAGSSGDGGLDIVGTVKFEESDFGLGGVTIFGQCATGEDWDKKIYESAVTRWRRWISFWSDPANSIFIPYCYRDSNGSWFDRKGFGTIIIDRIRILNLLNGTSRSDVLSLLKDDKWFSISFDEAA